MSEPNKRFPMEGLEIWRNPKNRFLVFQLHYLANPNKRSDEWRKTTASNLTRAKFLQEYEITWETWEGKPVYPDFSLKIHGSTESLEPEPGLPLLLGFDFGLTPACVVAQLQGRQLVILKEFVSENMGIARFSKEIVVPELKIMFPYWRDMRKDYICFVDPAGLSKAQTDETTCVQHLFAAGFRNITPGKIDWESRRSAVEKFLIGYFRRGTEILPSLKIDRGECPKLTQGFTGGFRYPDKFMEIEPDEIKPIKNEYSHPHDALQYLCSMATELVRPGYGPTADIKVPGYRFGG